MNHGCSNLYCRYVYALEPPWDSEDTVRPVEEVHAGATSRPHSTRRRHTDCAFATGPRRSGRGRSPGRRRHRALVSVEGRPALSAQRACRRGRRGASRSRSCHETPDSMATDYGHCGRWRLLLCLAPLSGIALTVPGRSRRWGNGPATSAASTGGLGRALLGWSEMGWTCWQRWRPEHTPARWSCTVLAVCAESSSAPPTHMCRPRPRGGGKGAIFWW